MVIANTIKAKGGKRMAYEESKDKTIKEWRFPLTDDSYLYASAHNYDGKSLKFQVGPRSYKDKLETIQYAKAGRLNYDEVVWLQGVLQEFVALVEEESASKK